ncbi:hypothetical protein P692DRAFT_20818527 [Suillus brevipes Sb2]|nr:hypothetical protein P692DRAFT_20818527 [Suillus brevipes Sb2]
MPVLLPLGPMRHQKHSTAADAPLLSSHASHLQLSGSLCSFGALSRIDWPCLKTFALTGNAPVTQPYEPPAHVQLFNIFLVSPLHLAKQKSTVCSRMLLPAASITSKCPHLQTLEIEKCGYHDGKSDSSWQEFLEALSPLSALRDLRICMQFSEYDDVDEFLKSSVGLRYVIVVPRSSILPPPS